MAKKTLDSNIGFDDIASRLHFTQVALGLAGDDGDKEVAALLPPLGKLLLRWQDLDRDKTAQGLATIRGHALCKRRDMQLDAALTAVHNATLSAANQDLSLIHISTGRIWEPIVKRDGSTAPVSRAGLGCRKVGLCRVCLGDFEHLDGQTRS